MSNDTLIGIDCGATKIMVQSGARDKSLDKVIPGKIHSEFFYNQNPNWNNSFKPVPIEIQKKQLEEGKISLTKSEISQGKAFIQSVNKVLSLFKSYKTGICFPGIKDNNGIIIMANGPRIPTLKGKLQKKGKILNDSDCCLKGEWKSTIGKMQDQTNCVYVGGGTGIADGVIMDGKLIDPNKTILYKRAWELKSVNGKSVESLLSPGGILKNYNERFRRNFRRLDEISNQKEFMFFMNLALEGFSTLIENRINFFNINGHEIHRIIIGQRLGSFLEKCDNSLKNMFQSVTSIPIVYSSDRRTAALGAIWDISC